MKPAHSSSASMMSVKRDVTTDGQGDDLEFTISEPTTLALMKRPTQVIMSPSSSHEKPREAEDEEGEQKWWEKLMSRRREGSRREQSV